MNNFEVTYTPLDPNEKATISVNILADIIDETAATEAAEKFKLANPDRSHNVSDYEIHYFLNRSKH